MGRRKGGGLVVEVPGSHDLTRRVATQERHLESWKRMGPTNGDQAIQGQMILAFVEDGTLRLHRSEEEATAEYEGVDVESRVVMFYREDGVYLEPVFTEPNRYGRLLGLISWSESGTYHLEPRPGTAEYPLWLALLEHPILEPGLGFGSMEELRRHLKENGAAVENPRLS